MKIKDSNIWEGIIDLDYISQENETKLSYNKMQAPFKIQKPFYPEGKKICHNIILHTAGGVVGGDRLSINVDLQPDAKVLITTASAGKIYRSNGKIAIQNTQIKIDKGAYLEFLPQENIIFNGANYEQNMRVELGEGGMWIGWEINRFGRSARGEKFTEGEWRSHTEVWQDGSPLWIDRQYLKANTEIINSYNGLKGMSIIASLVFVGKKVESEILEKARNFGLNHQLEGEIGITRLQKGLLCRYRGNSSTESRNWLIKIWHLLRGNYGELNPIIPRVWPEIKGL